MLYACTRRIAPHILALLWSVLFVIPAHAQHSAGKTTTLGTRSQLAVGVTSQRSPAAGAWDAYARPADYPGIARQPLQFIETANGERLAVLVTLPGDADGNPVPGKFPVILTQTAYRIDLGALLGRIETLPATLMIGGEDPFMITRGYITVAVDAYGTGMSSGVSALLGAEEQAGYAAAVDWVTRQPWFDGNIGVAGTSYLAITALLTAAQGHPAIKAAFAEMPMGDAYRGTVGTGGLINANFISTWMTLTQNLSVANGPALRRYPQYSEQIAAADADHVAAVQQWYLPTVERALAGEAGYASDDGEFWALRSPVELARDIRVPTFIMGSANDIFQRGEPLLYEQLKQQVNSKLVILPGAHVQSILAAAQGANNYISRGAPASAELLLRWFDQYLKGMDTGAETLPNVTQYVAGLGRNDTPRYVVSADWPHPGLTPQRWFMRGEGLSLQGPREADQSALLYEPAAPVVSINASGDGRHLRGNVEPADGSACSSSAVQWSLGFAGLLPQDCHEDNSEVELAQDALVFETPPLEEDLYLNGPMQADIWVSSAAPHATVAVRLSDVDPAGVARPITTGLQSAAYRALDPTRSRFVKGIMMQPWHPFTQASLQPLIANEPVRASVELFPAAALIRAGHRLRVSISASNQVQGIWPLDQQMLVTANALRVHYSATYPSSVVLAVVPGAQMGF
ncbi:CocE/NonD family hydrolase [Mangrovimicrobium sediminis]|uniref:CocE/NonD family hydrolase n=1 Tax=Mangrovimicrobium sediminis TaxID=2562682 RepID=A0A4Z0M6K2_9GAMM|nr:CocE/NonD family hydrolase [Haliea sp. SAOS-164]TGD75293.1 CocE/NonD family hydrolase [Haliea sp. SAOS-164]